jgi:hypothetical protein
MQTTKLLAVLSVAALVVLAGCGGGTTEANESSPAGTATDGMVTTTDGMDGTETTTGGMDGTETTTDGMDGTETTTDGMDGTETTTAGPADGNESASVTFSDQTVADGNVTVDSATLPEGGFVVIHRSDDGSPGEVIGNSTYLEPGTHEDVVVELDVTLDESAELIAMAHQDTNDNQEYEFPDADEPYTVDGSPVVDSANVSVDDGTATGTATGTTTTTSS